MVGLLGMISVVTGALESGEPTDDSAVLRVEGWILGRPPTSQAPMVDRKGSPYEDKAAIRDDEIRILTEPVHWTVSLTTGDVLTVWADTATKVP